MLQYGNRFHMVYIRDDRAKDPYCFRGGRIEISGKDVWHIPLLVNDLHDLAAVFFADVSAVIDNT